MMKPLLAIYLSMSIVCFAAYGLDKFAAKAGLWRIPETTLHLMELLCGWPGALMGQRLFCHKRAKREYMWRFGGVVVVNVMAVACFAFLRKNG